jgi:hypothetical protein
MDSDSAAAGVGLPIPRRSFAARKKCDGDGDLGDLGDFGDLGDVGAGELGFELGLSLFAFFVKNAIGDDGDPRVLDRGDGLSAIASSSTLTSPTDFRGDAVAFVGDRVVVVVDASYSKSCDVDVNPNAFIRDSFEFGLSPASRRGAFALSSSCISATMSTPPSGRSPWLDFNLIAFALLSGESAFVDADLRNRAACSCFILRASASSRIFMSFCTLSNVTKKSLTSLKTLPALSALNG